MPFERVTRLVAPYGPLDLPVANTTCNEAKRYELRNRNIVDGHPIIQCNRTEALDWQSLAVLIFVKTAPSQPPNNSNEAIRLHHSTSVK